MAKCLCSGEVLTGVGSVVRKSLGMMTTFTTSLFCNLFRLSFSCGHPACISFLGDHGCLPLFETNLSLCLATLPDVFGGAASATKRRKAREIRVIILERTVQIFFARSFLVDFESWQILWLGPENMVMETRRTFVVP